MIYQFSGEKCNKAIEQEGEGDEKMIQKLGMIGSLFMALCLISCGRAEQPEISETPEVTVTAEPTMTSESEVTPQPTPIPKTAKKTIEECFRGWLDDETPEEVQEKYFQEELEGERWDDLMDWKDAKGNFVAPKGYQINFRPSMNGLEEMASQQMPPELLEEIGTEELYQLIMSLPIKIKEMGWGTFIRDSYLQFLSEYYLCYNFMTDFMRRKDASEVVHRYYQKYSKKEKKKYCFANRASFEDAGVEGMKAERFRITEGLEWLFLYKEGKKVPDERVLGLGVGANY